MQIGILVQREVNREMDKWIYSAISAGKIIKNRQELMKLFPGKKIEKKTNFISPPKFKYYYYNKNGEEKKIAYECPHCKNLVFGAPEITDYVISFSEHEILYSCRNCKWNMSFVPIKI